jgi:hypothetical protein
MCNKNDNIPQLPIPLYEEDDGPLTDEQIATIRKMNAHLDGAKWTRSIFDIFNDLENKKSIFDTFDDIDNKK